VSIKQFSGDEMLHMTDDVANLQSLVQQTSFAKLTHKNFHSVISKKPKLKSGKKIINALSFSFFAQILPLHFRPLIPQF